MGLCEVKSSSVYTVSSRSAKDTQREPVSKQINNNKITPEQRPPKDSAESAQQERLAHLCLLLYYLMVLES